MMASIASIEASKLWKCETYYVFIFLYDPHSRGPRNKGEFYIETPITFPINKPKEKYLRSLKMVAELIKIKYESKEYNYKQEKFIYKKKLIEELETKGFID